MQFLSNTFLSNLRLKKCSVPPLVVFTTTTQAKERHVNYSTYLLLALATAIPDQSKPSNDEEHTLPSLDDVLTPAMRMIVELVETFRTKAVDSQTVHLFEEQLQQQLRELGRHTIQWTYNSIDPAVGQLPKHLQFQNNHYTRLNRKTPQNVWTLFGQIKLWRVGYRPTDKIPEPTIFPLAMALGLIQGASPALAERVGICLAESGMTQKRTLQRLRHDHDVGWGVKKLREVGAALASQMTPHQHDVQVEQLLAWLQQADASRGRHKPLLCVGRDGVTLGMRYKSVCLFEVASTATVSVLDRRGKRLGTVYLAYVPELGQKTMSVTLTKLLEEVLRRWEGGALRLGYVTDAGDNETSYYEKTLEEMLHPRTEEQLKWIRVVDYYHVSQRVWTMSEALFGKCQSGTSWAKKMLKWLLKPSGANRVLHSAAALRDRKRLQGQVLVEFQKAYGYIRDRMGYLNYAEYRRVGLPCGSGVTEAACKTVYAQRLKLSGMRWKRAGAQVILDLRVLLLSGVWDATYQRVLRDREQPQVRTQCTLAKQRATIHL